MSEANLLRAKKTHYGAVAERRKNGAEAAGISSKSLPEEELVRSESGVPVANPKNRPDYHVANIVVEYLVKQRTVSPEKWPRIAAYQYPTAHKQILKEGSPHNIAFKAAIRQLKTNPKLADRPEELEARLRLVLESRRKKI